MSTKALLVRTGRLRDLGWAALAVFTIKGLAWLALGAGAWRIFR
jgi:hypothetical protein